MKTISKNIVLAAGLALGLMSAIPALAQETATLSVTSAIRFSKQMGLGSSGADVTALQKLLNARAGSLVSLTGAGSPGNEGTYFGTLTKRALQAFQKAQGIPATGYVGPLTLAALNREYSSTTVSLPVIHSVTAASGAAPGTASLKLVYSGGNEAPTVWFGLGAAPSATTILSSTLTGDKGAGVIASELASLSGGKEYFVRAYVKNSAGTTESQVIQVVVPSY